MVVETLQKEIERLGLEEQERLAAYLHVLRLERDPAHAQLLSDRLADTNPGHWLTLDELNKKLAAE